MTGHDAVEGALSQGRTNDLEGRGGVQGSEVELEMT